MKAGAFDAVICRHWELGGAGAADLATAVVQASKEPTEFKFLYDLNVRLLL